MEDTSQGSPELLDSSVGGALAGKRCPGWKHPDLLHISVGRALAGQICFKVRLVEHCEKKRYTSKVTMFRFAS